MLLLACCAAAAVLALLTLVYSYRSIVVAPGTVVVITGASSGIGEAVALWYAQRGCRLVLAARRRDRLERVAKRCAELGAEDTLIVETDVSDMDQCKGLVDTTIEKFGAMHRLVMSAGVSMHAEFSRFELPAFERQMDINFKAPVHLTKHALPHLIATHGKICAVSSLLGIGIAPRNTAYCASKHALNAFFDSLRPELAQHGITISVVCPGPVDTEILHNLDGQAGSIVSMKLSATDKLMLWSAQAAGDRCACNTERSVGYDGFPINLWWFVRFRTVVPWLCDAVFSYFYTSFTMETTAPPAPTPTAQKRRAASKQIPTQQHQPVPTDDTDAGIWELPAGPAPSGLAALSGPGRLPLETALLYTGLTVPSWVLCGHAYFTGAGWGLEQYAAGSFLAGDLVAGVVIFSSSSGKRWWHRPERRTIWEQMKYVFVVGAHPFLAALLFREGALKERAVWYGLAYGYLAVAVMVIACAPLHYRRLVAACLFMVALMTEARLAAYTPLLEWVLPLYYFKYLCCYPIREEPYRPPDEAGSRAVDRLKVQ